MEHHQPGERTDLQEILFPLLIHHNLYFLTLTRQLQFNKAMYILTHRVSQFTAIPATTITMLANETKAKDYLNLWFFTDWLVGFTVAPWSSLFPTSWEQVGTGGVRTEGSFVVKSRGDISFQIRQRAEGHIELFKAITLLFNTRRTVEVSPGSKYLQFSVGSVKEIERVVHFFSFSPWSSLRPSGGGVRTGLHPLVGLKQKGYERWIIAIKGMKRFSALKLPDIGHTSCTTDSFPKSCEKQG